MENVVSIYRYRAEHEALKKKLGIDWPSSFWTEHDPREIAVIFSFIGVGVILFTVFTGNFSTACGYEDGACKGLERQVHGFLLFLTALWWIFKKMYERKISPLSEKRLREALQSRSQNTPTE
jgi:hypothetical protein